MNPQLLITRDDIVSILRTVKLQQNEFDRSINGNFSMLGQKLASELMSKLTELNSASYFSKKIGIKVDVGTSDKHPDNTFHFATGDATLEWKVAQTQKSNKRVIFRGGGLSNRSSDAVFVARNLDFTKFFVAVMYMTPEDWTLYNTAYYAPNISEEALYNKNATVLIGSFGTETTGLRKGKPIICLESI